MSHRKLAAFKLSFHLHLALELPVFSEQEELDRLPLQEVWLTLASQFTEIHRIQE
jgi:hypothetical protein